MIKNETIYLFHPLIYVGATSGRPFKPVIFNPSVADGHLNHSVFISPTPLYGFIDSKKAAM